MKTKAEFNIEILETIATIQENYPELSKFEDEMTITIPTGVKPEISASDLEDYQDSLQALLSGYAKNTNKHIVIIGAGCAGLKIART